MENVHGSLIGVGTIPSVGKVHKGVPITGLYFVMFSSSLEFLGSAKRVPKIINFVFCHKICPTPTSHTHTFIPVHICERGNTSRMLTHELSWWIRELGGRSVVCKLSC